jgi:caa(3)-type oxidase subunit IV
MAADHASHAGHADHGHGESHAQHYIRTWMLLCVLLVISIAGPMLEIQIITLLTAFGIAGVKAWIVMKHFMHLTVEKPIVIYILATSVAFMVMMFSAVGIDVLNHEGARWSNEAAKQAISRGMAYGDPADHHLGGDHGGHGAPAEGAAHPAPAGH